MNNKTVVITGSSSGIGEALAYAMAKTGVNLILFARREDRLRQVAHRCKELGSPWVEVQRGDIGKKEEVIMLQERAKEFPGEIILVNNAGIFDSTDFSKASLDIIEEQVRVNLLGVFYATHALLPIMLERNIGQIINISSIAAKIIFPGSSVYSATKAGLLSFSGVLSKEVRGKGIRVCTVLPGMTHTDIWSHLDENTKSKILSAEAVAERIKDLILLSKDITIDEITITPSKGTF